MSANLENPAVATGLEKVNPHPKLFTEYVSYKMMLLKCFNQFASKFGKLSNGHRTGKGQSSFQSQRKAMPKKAQTTTQLHSSHMLVK